MTEQEIKALLQEVGDLYRKGQFDKAAEILRRIKREDSPELYAEAQFNLGVALRKQGKTEEAIAVYRSIKREDSPETYAKAQFNLGVALGKQGDTEGEIAAYRNITRKDSPEPYAKAQFNLGVVLGEQGDIEGEIAAYRNITREDLPEQYAMAQVNLGVALGKQGDTEGAIAAYRNIIREDSREQYAKAQVNLGVILGEQGDTEGAIAAYRNIIREDSSELYAKAQFNLGVILGEQGDTEEAISAYRNITREDSREQYAKAQVNLGVALAKQGKTDEAIDTFRNIQPEDSKEPYAKAQLSLGMILEARGDTEGAIAACRNVTCEDSPEQYAKAQLYLGIILGKQGDTEGAIAAYRNITREDLPELYAMAQFNLGVALQEQGKIEEAKQAFSNSRSVFYYQAESQLKILNCPPGSRSNLRAVYDAIVSIITTLFISSGRGMAGENPLKVAHYTRPSIARVLIAGEEDKASSLRLNTVKNTNDPTEGKILYGYLHKSCGLLSGVLDVEQESDSQALAAFISCFTFNHDSLNQFRLYGKEGGLEASGVSLVFGKRFFSAKDPFAIMTVASEREAIMTANNTIEDSRPERADKTTQKKLDKLPLYRCIYLDPQNGYVSIAHRDKVTFYAEAWHNDKIAVHKKLCKKAEKNWKKYQAEINKLTEKVKEDLSTLSEEIQAIAKDAENNVLQTLVFILQPLRYLVKHAAFQEEQECRMVYIIGDLLKDERIRTDWGAKQMYLEYAAPVRNSLDKIYLSPGAEPYADFFKRELPHLAKKGGIRRSQNPFRNK
mgnify:CR=1 FL=1